MQTIRPDFRPRPTVHLSEARWAGPTSAGVLPSTSAWGAGPHACRIKVKAVAVAVRAGVGRVEHNDRFASLAHLIEVRLPDDLSCAFGPGGEGFAIRHELSISRPKGPFVEDSLITFRLASRARLWTTIPPWPEARSNVPFCGEDVPAKAKSCPHCGACEKSGWNEDNRAADGLDLPDDDFDYEKFAHEEFGTPAKLAGKQLVWKDNRSGHPGADRGCLRGPAVSVVARDLRARGELVNATSIRPRAFEPVTRGDGCHGAGRTRRWPGLLVARVVPARRDDRKRTRLSGGLASCALRASGQ